MKSVIREAIPGRLGRMQGRRRDRVHGGTFPRGCGKSGKGRRANPVSGARMTNRGRCCTMEEEPEQEGRIHMNTVLARQLALDYHCTSDQVTDGMNHFLPHAFLEGRRRFQEKEECMLKIAAVNGKLLFTGQESILAWCRETYADTGAAWFMEARNMRRLDDKLLQEGFRISMAHPFYISERVEPVETDGAEILFLEAEDIEQYRGDSRYDEAFAFDPKAPDVLGVAALRDGKILGMAGASSDSPLMWQIGINVDTAERGRGIGSMLVRLLKNEVIRRGHLPYYGTSMSHIASQNVAIRAGFRPAWAEIVTSRVEDTP